MDNIPINNSDTSREFIIGTAGHIDHGKTVLIKALTGRETDRLKEEKERGISIDLGFAPFELPDGRTAGIVDVPGHEHFIRNMLAGATAMDLVLLTVAADDGVMPQTREHLAILDLLGVRRGIAVITKVDLVEEELTDLVAEEVEELLEGTALEGSPVVKVSGVTGEGIEELKLLIFRLAEEIEDKDLGLPPRLPIDRVFTLRGIGTVVTGTLWSGTIGKGDILQILPDDLEARVKSLQVHEHERDSVFAGERVAASLVGVKHDQLVRGDTLTGPGFLRPSHMIDARVLLLKEAPRPLKNRNRLRLHHGTREVMGRMYLLDREALKPGEQCLAQLRLEAPVVPRYGDKFILRSYSPVTTIGGGTILDPHPEKHRHRDVDKVISLLKIMKEGELKKMIPALLEDRAVPMTRASLVKRSSLSPGEIDEVLAELVKEGVLVGIGAGPDRGYLLGEKIEELAGDAEKVLEEFLKENPLSAGMDKELLKQKAFGLWPQKLADAILLDLEEKGRMALSGKFVNWPDRTVSLNEDQGALYARCLEELKRKPSSPPTVRELSVKVNREVAEIRSLLRVGESKGDLIFISPDICYTKEVLERIKSGSTNYLKEHGSITVSEFRKLADTSRKYAVPLLEYFDRMRLTIREGDIRKLR